MVEYYCCNSGVCPAMEDCMLTCAKDAINRQTNEVIFTKNSTLQGVTKHT